MNRKNIKRFAILMVLASVCAVSAFADTSSTQAASALSTTIADKMNIFLAVLGSPWVKGIALIALIIEAILLMTAGRSEPGMFKKFIPWIAGTIIFMAASAITNAFVNTNANSFTITGYVDNGVELIV